MSGNIASNKHKEGSFWHHYINNLRQRGLNDKFVRWHVIRAEEYLRSLSDKSIRTHSPADIQKFFEKAGRKEGIQAAIPDVPLSCCN